MVFNPEDGENFGPHCRNCHKGSSRCSVCHAGGAYTVDSTIAADNTAGKSLYTMSKTSTGDTNTIGSKTDLVAADGFNTLGFFKKSRTVDWSTDWRSSETTVAIGAVDGDCADDGFSWPHRTLGWKMLKDDLFGLDFDNNTTIDVGQSRTFGTETIGPAHDLDSVCLDCHNPTIWNATGPSHVDDPNETSDNHNDELLTRGLP